MLPDGQDCITATWPHDLQAKAKAVEPRLWKKAMAAERVRREYRTADELLAEQSEKPALQASQPILDMRGPQARLVTDMEALNAAEVRAGRHHSCRHCKTAHGYDAG